MMQLYERALSPWIAAVDKVFDYRVECLEWAEDLRNAAAICEQLPKIKEIEKVEGLTDAVKAQYAQVLEA